MAPPSATAPPTLTLPSPCLVVLVGPAASGKSTWAAEWFPAHQVVSSDALRALVGDGEHDLGASKDAFALLDTVVQQRLRRRITTVVDTLALDPAQRARYRALAEAGRRPVLRHRLRCPTGRDPGAEPGSGHDRPDGGRERAAEGLARRARRPRRRRGSPPSTRRAR